MTLVSRASHDTDPTDDEHFQSTVENRITTLDVPMVEPADLTRLPKGQAFMLKEGGQLHKIRLPLPKNEADDLPDEIRVLTQSMRKDIQQSQSNQWHRDDWWRSTIGGSVNADDFKRMVQGEQPGQKGSDNEADYSEAVSLESDALEVAN